jgi:transcriptional regulator with XRE-family HTH domain
MGGACQFRYAFPVSETSVDGIAKALIDLIAEERRLQGLTYEQLADRAGIHRTTIALWERQERNPTVQLALQLASALNTPLSRLLARAEAACNPKHAATASSVRRLRAECFRNEAKLRQLTGLTHQTIRGAIEDSYQTLDLIDLELGQRGSPPVSWLVDLANLSSMIGNLLCAGLVQHSGGAYVRNAPHTYPDLIAKIAGRSGIEVKTALETNKPKGHLPKLGVHLTFRYVLCNQEGKFTRGKESRGDTAFVWEVKAGRLAAADFDLSNTAGDSGKTAVVKTSVLNKMTLVFFDPKLLPYASSKDGTYPGIN